MRRKYRIAVADDGYVAEIRKFGRWTLLNGGSRWGAIGGSLDEAEIIIQQHIKSDPPAGGYTIFKQRAHWESKDASQPPADILHHPTALTRPQAGERSGRIHALATDDQNNIGLAEAIGAIEIAKHTLLSGELINKISGR